MYHYITIAGIAINMTGLGIVAFLVTFLYITARDARWRGLRFQPFLKFIPLYIIIIYLAGTYVYYLFDSFILIPLSFNQILLYITPYQYNFSTVGIILGVILGGWRFLKNKEKKLARLNSFLYGLVRGLVPLGIFLLLGDSFIGLPTDGGFFISAIRNDSNVAIYDKVIPLGFYLSLIGLVGGSILFLFHKTMAMRHAYLGYSILAMLLSILFVFQQYPRRFVFSLGGQTMDSKQLLLWIIALAFLTLWIRSTIRVNKASMKTIHENTL